MIFNILKKVFAQVVLAADSDLTWSDKFYYILMSLSKIAPVAFLMSGLNMWFNSNKLFFTFLVYVLLANMFAGVWRHRKERSFSWEKFFYKNFQMWIIILMTYPVLEMIHILTGDNAISEVFIVVIQLATLLYPGSKFLKNMYIISNKQFPPQFIMERLYRFEKTGSPNKLFSEEQESLTEDEQKEFEDKFKKK